MVGFVYLITDTYNYIIIPMRKPSYSFIYYTIAQGNYFYLLCFIGTTLCLRKFLANESPLKIAKNAFYFTFKAVFVLKILKNGFIRNTRLISKFVT